MRQHSIGGSVLLTALAIVTSECAALPAFAQDPSARAPRDATAKALASSDADAGDIIVTGRKREERLQDLPGGGQAFDSARLVTEHIDNLKDLLRRVPGGVTADLGTSFSNEVIIRGQGSGRAVNSEVATGLYRNGAFVEGGNIGGRNFNRLDLFDAQQIEVFRGPQGALFGRDAVGGAINVVSARPTANLSGSATLRYGTNDRFEAEGVINVPLSSDFAVRFSGIHIKQNKGFFYNSFDGRYQDRESFDGGRLVARYAPPSGLEAILTVDGFFERGPSFAVGNYNPNIAGNPYVARDNVDSRFSQQQQSAILELNYDTSVGKLSSTTYYIHRAGNTIDDLDGFLNITSPLFANFFRDSRDSFDRFGQEVHLASHGTGPLKWLVGAEFLSLHDDYFEESQGLAPPVAGSNNNTAAVSNDKSYAVFGSLSYDLSPAFTLAVEGRYSLDTKAVDLHATIYSATNIPTAIVNNPKRDFSNVSPTVSAIYKPSDAVTLFGRIATAYRGGGFNPTPDALTPARFSISYGSEKTISYEAGAKAALFRRRLHVGVTLYDTDTSDILVTDRVAVGPAFINFVRNGGKANLHGAEFDLASSIPVHLTGGRIELNGSASLARGRFTSGTFDGLAVPYVRPYQASFSSTYRQPIGADLSLFLTNSFLGAWHGWQDQPSNRRLENIVLDDVAAGIDAKHWRAAINVTNVFDAFYNPQRTSVNAVRASRPRALLASITTRF